MFKRECPDCGKILTYNNKRNLNYAIEQNSLCSICSAKKRKGSFERKCPNCNNTIKYLKKISCEKEEKYNLICDCCSTKLKNEQGYIYLRKCPDCGKDIYYKNKGSYMSAIDNNATCLSCAIKKSSNKEKSFKRNCPNCNNEILYINESTCINAEKEKKLCPSCIIKKSNLEEKKYIIQCPNCNNNMYYKTLKGFNIANENNTLCYSCRNEITSKKKIGKPSKLKGTTHKSMYDLWLQKYGEEEANQRLLEFKRKCSNRSKGENNPMFGKPAAEGAGRGWSGKYKGYQFRSMLELDYLIYLLDNNIEFENGELKQYRVPYIMNNVNRNYLLDYYLPNTDEYIELKPYKLLDTTQNQLKFEAAKKIYGNKYKVITDKDIANIDINRLYDLYINKEIIFNKGYSEKFEKKYNKMHK